MHLKMLGQNIETKMAFVPMQIDLSEEIVIPPSHLGDIMGSVCAKLYQMYIDMSCPRLGIGLDISNIKIGLITIDPNNGACVAQVIFTLKHVMPKVGTVVQKSTSSGDLEIASFDETDEQIAIRFEGNASQYEITLSQYVDHNSELPIDPNIRFVCLAKAAQ